MTDKPEETIGQLLDQYRDEIARLSEHAVALEAELARLQAKYEKKGIDRG
jgi:hypothetical protein